MTSSPKDPKAVLPESWLSGPPDAPLPVEHTGRLPECDADLVADALQQAAKIDGPEAVRKPLRKVLFALAWPAEVGRRDVLDLRLRAAAELLEQAMGDSPSVVPLFTAQVIAAEWWRAHEDVAVHLGIERDDLRCEPKEFPCAWATLDEVLAAVKERVSWGTGAPFPAP